MDQNYLQKNNILIRKEAYPFIAQIDTIIFDIDGVLVDVDLSYYQTIIDTVQYYFHQVIHVPGNINLIDKNTILNFKTIGGFNDDWELTAAVILYYLWKMKEYRLNFLKELKDLPPLIDNFMIENLSGGGGLPQLVNWIKNNASSPDEVFNLWDKERIFKLAQEFYAGEKYCFRLYHFHPKMLKRFKGNIEKERAIIKPEVVEIARQYHVGILTGRSRAETELLMERISWNAWLAPETMITFEDDMGKPSPDGIKVLMKKFQSKLGVYIGDTMDDLLTVNHLNRYLEQQSCLSALVLGNHFSEKEATILYYMEHHVDLLAENVNQVIQLIDRTSGKL